MEQKRSLFCIAAFKGRQKPVRFRTAEGEVNMLEAASAKKREISNVHREENALYLEQEAGILRIIPQEAGILRISYTENGNFGTKQGEELSDLSSSCVWDWKETQGEILVDTGFLQAAVNRLTGSITYRKKDGSLLLAERERESHVVEEFDSYRTVINENTRVEEFQTPDGVKRRIREADRVFDRKLYHTRLELSFDKGERLFGLGQAEEGVWNLRGTTQYLHQANLKIALPVLLSEKGWGILSSTQSPAIFSDTGYGSYLYTEADEFLDYYFLAGENLNQVTAGIRRLTGKAAMLPRWAFGYIQSQERYVDAQELLDTADRFRRNHIGLDCMVLDWMSWKGNLWGQKTFDEERFPDPAGMIKELHEKDVHFMLSIWPNMSAQCGNYQEFLDKGQLLPASEIYDAFSEEGRKLYWEQAERGLFRHGVDAWWCDSSEPVTPEWGRPVKPVPEEMYREFVEAAGSCMPPEQTNAYGLYHARAIYEGQRGSTEEKRVMNLTRNGYLGSQRYGTILWSGDTCARWETLRRQIAAGLQFCACGIPYWTLDIGAFFVKKGAPWFWDGAFDEGNADPGYRELYTRWFQYGAFLPIFRSHGTDCRREPWNFGREGEPFYEAILAAIRLRYRLLPYIYSVAGSVWREDAAMMRPLVFDFPGGAAAGDTIAGDTATDDKRAADVSDEYLFGPALLVCPVTEPMYYLPGGVPVENGEKTRKVYLPKGTQWYDLRDGKKYEGGQEITAPADITSIPVYVRAGSILPVTEPGESAARTAEGKVTLQIYPGADGTFTWYEDAGDGYGYEKGEYCLTRITYRDADRSVSWESGYGGRKVSGQELPEWSRAGEFDVEIMEEQI